jgi:large subunit ribosomal protein L33
MAGKSGRQTIMLESTAGTGYRIYTTKNKRITVEKLRLRKYDPMVRRHVDFVEKRMPSHSK